MIILNRDKELVTVENWDDIESRPGFNGSLDPTAHTLDSIIGRYTFRNYVPCGLSNCHTPHGKGYIVLTKDGQETNIGKDCGRNYFGVDFETLSAQFDRDLQEKEYREKVFSFVFRLDEVAASIEQLRGGERGGNWVYKASRPLVNAGKDVPGAIVRRIAQMVRTGSTLLTHDREATEEEIKLLEQQEGRRIERPHGVSIPIGEVAGLDALYKENDLKTLLVIELAEPLKELESVDVDALDFNGARKWSRWIGEVEGKMARAARAIERGQKLLTAANLRPFGEALELNTEGIMQFESYLKTLPAA
ncbi:MAG: hypothetical protein QM749_01615 [Aquabacterium sp.]